MFNIPGKINHVKQAAIDIEISAGVMFDYQTWIPATQHQQYFGNNVVPHYQHLRLQIELDNTVLLNQSVGTDKIKFHHDFVDSETDCDHLLKITIQGMEPEFNQFYQDKDVFTMLKIDNISIENLPMQYVLEQTGQYYCNNTIESTSRYLGHNGSCVLKFTTPIYGWLFSNGELIKHIVDEVNNYETF
jgi:hypothetical protein